MTLRCSEQMMIAKWFTFADEALDIVKTAQFACLLSRREEHVNDCYNEK